MSLFNDPSRTTRFARDAALLFLLSLAVRGAALVLAGVPGMPALFDEQAYVNLARGVEEVFSHLASGQFPTARAWNRAYGGGVWPPLHPLLLAVGFMVSDHDVFAARLVVVVLSALTTPLVYGLTRRLSSARAARAAALLHVFHPSFVAYAHFLWSETTNIFFLLPGVLFAARALDAGTSRARMLHAGLAGCFLGLGGLSRAAALPYIAAVPLALVLFLPGWRDRLLAPAVALGCCLLVLLPWEATLLQREERIVPISTRSGYNLHLGNNPWVPEGAGSSWQHEPSKKQSWRAARAYAREHGLGVDAAARALALEHIREEPGTFLRRCLERLRMLWSLDAFVMRHTFHLIYPPMPRGVAALLWALLFAAHLAVPVLAAWGFLARAPALRHRGLLLLLLVAGMAPAMLTIAMSRLHLPLLALLLPAAGHGLAHLRQPVSVLRGGVTALLGASLLVGTLTSLPIVLNLHVRPSSYYAPVIGPVNGLAGPEIPFTDRVALRVRGGPLPNAITATLSGDRWLNHSGADTLQWRASSEHRSAQLRIISSSDAEAPLEVSLFSEASGRRVTIRPIRPFAHGQWHPTGVDGIEYQWAGGGPLPKHSPFY